MKMFSLIAGLSVCFLVFGCKEKVALAKNSTLASALSNNDSVSVKPKFDTSISSVMTQFKVVLGAKSTKTLDSIVDPSGLTVIRNFTSGTLGGRGSNIRNFYPFPLASRFDSSVFPVPGETPVKFSEMFPDFQKVSDPSLPVFQDVFNNFAIQDDSASVKRSTKELVGVLTAIATKHHDGQTPFVAKVNDDYIILAEGDAVDSICTGYYSVFHKVKETYKLKAVLDLR